MTDQIEFSSFFKELNFHKTYDTEDCSPLLKSFLSNYQQGSQANSFLEDLAQQFIVVGINELYSYSGSENLNTICNLTTEEWDSIKNEKKADIAPTLANSMINYTKQNKILNKLKDKWSVRRREIEKHVMPMSRYITEGILDAID